jgi:hypothetical protein
MRQPYLPANLDRCRRIVDTARSAMKLDLDGLAVLTEAATGCYALTPAIAALAGARRVYALARDSSYGLAQDIARAHTQLALQWGVRDKIEVLLSREDPGIADADIVTNLGFVRPLNADLLRRLKPSAVISLMWETWECRPDEIDLDECHRLGIPVLGTDERHPDLDTFSYVGETAIKLFHAADIELLRSRLVVLGDGVFAQAAARRLAACGADVTVWSLDHSVPTDRHRLLHKITTCDGLLIAHHTPSQAIIGEGAYLSPTELASLNPGLVVTCISGCTDTLALITAGLRCVPERQPARGHMSVRTDYVGPRAVIELNTAGLAVGQHLARARKAGLSPQAAQALACSETALAQSFPNESSTPSDPDRVPTDKSPALPR